jgi:hypothetical protein
MNDVMRSSFCTRVLAPGIASLILAGGTAFAQGDLTGDWIMIGQQSETNQQNGPFPDDYTGIPLSKDGRAAALAFNPEAQEQLQRQCEPWSAQYLVNGPFGMRITTQRDPQTGRAVVLHLAPTLDRMQMDVWLDGRSAPAGALNTFGGFTTGVWHGETLMTTTTHIKDGFLTRNGVPNSSRETMIMFMTRHGELMTITAVFHDPVYLTAAYPWSETYRLSVTGGENMMLGATGMQCLPEETVSGLSDGYHTSTYLPGKNPLTNYMTSWYGIPPEAAMGGEATMLPSYQRQLEKSYRRPTGMCRQQCCGAEGSNPAGASVFFNFRVKDCPTD